MALPGGRTNPTWSQRVSCLSRAANNEQAVKAFETYDSIKEENPRSCQAGVGPLWISRNRPENLTEYRSKTMSPEYRTGLRGCRFPL